MENKSVSLNLIKDQQIVRVRKAYTETIKIREQAILSQTNTNIKKRFKTL